MVGSPLPLHGLTGICLSTEGGVSGNRCVRNTLRSCYRRILIDDMSVVIAIANEVNIDIELEDESDGLFCFEEGIRVCGQHMLQQVLAAINVFKKY